jgi:hypothetical protein
MKPPIFLLKSGTVDAFDTVEELADHYPPDTLSGDGCVACDCEGQILKPERRSDGTTVLVCDEQQPPSPDTLRSILRGYLERKGVSPEELDSASLADLVIKAYPPPDPRLESMKYRLIFQYVVIPAIGVVCIIIYRLFNWLYEPADHLIR